MPLLTFNPGPSKLSEETQRDITDAVTEGICSISHRSKEFTELSRRAIEGLRQLFAIPKDYSIFFTASATEAMERTIRSTVEKATFHFTLGSFSELFVNVSTLNGKTAHAQAAAWGSQVDYDAPVPPEAELLTVTMNETSTGVMCGNSVIHTLRQRYPDPLLVVDITSIAAMKVLDIASADIWLFSVQKGFGLPAGLGVLFVSPRSLERARSISETTTATGHGNFLMMQKNMENYQTPSTPNVLGIDLLRRQVERWNAHGGLVVKERETQAKAERIYAMLQGKIPGLRPFTTKTLDRSTTVIAATADNPEVIAQMHARAKNAGILLGKGYGKLKESTLRIANFPAITQRDIDVLEEALTKE